MNREQRSRSRTNWQDIGRKPEHVSVVELRNAMMHVVRLFGGISVNELHRETIRIFCRKRRTAGRTARLNEGLQYGMDIERLELRVDEIDVQKGWQPSCRPGTTHKRVNAGPCGSVHLAVDSGQNGHSQSERCYDHMTLPHRSTLEVRSATRVLSKADNGLDTLRER